MDITTILCALFPCAVLFIAALLLRKHDGKLLLNPRRDLEFMDCKIVYKHEWNGQPVYGCKIGGVQQEMAGED